MASSAPPSESLGETLPSQNSNISQQEDHPQSPPHSESQPSKTLTLEFPNLHNPEPHRSPQNPPELDENDHVPEAQTPRLNSRHDGDLLSVPPAAPPAIAVYKRGTKRKKGGHQKKRWAQEKKSMKKLEVLNETLKPIPFAPVKNLDFSSHEKLLKRLGLWDFVHMEFDRVIRADLLAQLIANFSPGQRCSYVNGVRVMVNRADLARALKLPVKKLTAAASDDADDEVPATEESIGFIEDFVLNWLLLHDDTWMMPNEVLNWMKGIKEGHWEKVDWAGMIWFMIEKELILTPQITNCYYASHLQCLVKSQKEELFLSKEVEEVEVEEEEPKVEVEVDVKEDDEVGGEEVDANGDVRMGVDDTDIHCGHVLEEHNTELSLGHDIVVEHNVELSLGQDNVVEKVDDEKEADIEKEADSGKEALLKEKEEEGAEERKEEDEVKEEAGEKEEEDELKEDAGEKEEEEEDEVKEEAGEKNEGENEVEGDVKKEEQVVGEESAMDFEESKEDDEPAPWFLDGKGNVGDPFMRQCSFGVESKDLVRAKDLVREDEMKLEEEEGQVGRDEEDEEEEGHEEMEEDEEETEEEQGEQEGGFRLSSKGFPLHGLSSGGLIQSMDAAQINLSPGMSLRDPLPGEFLSSREDTRMSLFANGSTSKRDHISLENDNSHHALNGNKRLRIDGPWDNSKPSSDFDMCMEQIQQLMGKARMMHSAKEQAYEESTMNQQILLNELQQRDNMIAHLEKARIEERQKRQFEVYRLERELNMMSNLLDGYRKALKENYKAFAEYRALCPQHDEPLYKDVAGSAGLVLSATELEKLRLKREEEERINRLMFERKIKDFEEWWDEKFSALGEDITQWDDKLLSVEQEMKLLKESYCAKRKVSETSEPAQNDS